MNSATPISREHATNVGVRNCSLLFIGCLLFHLAGTWSLPLIDRDEPRFAEASREMRQRGDYVVPYFNNLPRLDKPPLTYWCQVASYRVFGENDFAARFPSAVAASLTALLLFAWGSRIGSARVGWWAAIIFSLCLQTFVHAKAAVADMWLVFFVTAAHWAGYELLRNSLSELRHQPSTINHQPTPAWWWIFYITLAFAFLAKGPIGWTALGTVLATKLFLSDSTLAARFKFARGLLIMLAIISLWAIPAMIQTNGEFLRVGIGRHVIGRSFVTMEGHGAKSLAGYFIALPFYFIAVFVSFFPWSIKLPWLTARLGRTRDTVDNYLIAGAVIIFLIFTLVKTKLPHYTLPAFPLLALLLARHWVEQGTTLSKAPAAAESRRSQFKRMAIATACICLAAALFFFPVAARFFPAAQLFKASCNDLRSEMEFAAMGFNEPSLVWYFRDRINGFFNPNVDASSVKPFMEKPGPRFVIVPSDLATTLFPNPAPAWKMHSTSGINIAKGKRVDLTLVLKPE